jgi:hypothetical protein
VLGHDLRYVDGATQGTMTHNPNDACETHAMEAATIAKDTSSVLKSLAQRHLEASYATLVSQSIFEHWAMSSSTTEKLTPTSAWRTTISHAERVE